MYNSLTNQNKSSQEVRKGKDELLKERLKTLIISRGISEATFYSSLGLSKQVWYAISWGLWQPTKELKCRIAKALQTDSCVIWQEVENGI